ncbi:MAG: sodium-dependent transporter [Clostridia bacterium]|nr:sodium-dependent transporter [Clostridia bacterium]
MQRERLGSRLGFILLSAGCAIGIGNVWKFPYMVGQYGGGAFLLIYIFFLAIFGIPVLAVEFALGRASQKSPAKLYYALEPKKSKWHIHGYAAVAGNYLLMMFYTTVSGWILTYFIYSATGKFEGASQSAVSGIFDSLKQSPTEMMIYTAIVIVIGFLVCSIGVQKGLERVTKVMMIALLVIMVVLAINSIVTDKTGDGLKFYLVPNMDTVKEVGIWNIIVAAMNQAFFTLSLGIGNMAIFGSYIGKERSLMGEAVNVAVLDTFVAFCSGLIIFPACFAFGVQPDSGPSLIFITLPNIFNNLPFGRLWGSLFFIFLTFAALSTVFGVFENIICCVCETFGISRRKSCIINCILMLVLSIPCVLGFNLLSGITPLGAGSNIMDFEDFLVSNILLPLGAAVFVLFCTTRYGWGWKNFFNEVNTGKGLKLPAFMRKYMTFVLPAIIFAVFVIGIVNIFA